MAIDDEENTESTLRVDMLCACVDNHKALSC